MVAAPFDARLRRLRQGRAAPAPSFLSRRAAEDLIERLAGVNRRFARVLILGGTAAFQAALAERADVRDRLGAVVGLEAAAGRPGAALIADPEALPFAPQSFDLAVSLMTLHAVNDLPGALVQLRGALRPDGLFLGAMLGGETLKELRATLLAAELACAGGAAARVFPFADVRDAGALLQRAGFALPVVDVDTVRARYPTLFDLLADLRAMGETSCLADLATTPKLTRATLLNAAARYPTDTDGRRPATFDILTLTGWAPHESQPQPLKPGSAQVSLADVLRKR
jgi:SAM-dependent methyltransferase